MKTRSHAWTSAHPSSSTETLDADVARLPGPMVVKIIGLAIAYAILGNLSLLLTIPPGYAAPIWPAAGLSLVAVLVCGYRIWPGVLLGSFLSNVWSGWDGFSFQAVTIPLIIAGGAALQAVVAAYLVHRLTRFPNLMGSEREVFAFFFVGGVLSCVISPFVGNLVLLNFSIISASSFMENFWTWWIGDTIGVFVFSPLALVWVLRPVNIWRPRRLTVTVPILVALFVSLASTSMGMHWERERLRLEFDQRLTPLAQAVERNLSEYINVLKFLEGFYAASTHIDRGEFDAFSRRFLEELPGLHALSWNPLIPNAQRDAFETATRQDGFDGFTIRERLPTGTLIPAGERDEYVVVHYIEPFVRNRSAFGFDVASNPVRKVALELARDTGRPMATGRITLVQDQQEQFGILVFMPVYEHGKSIMSVQARQRYLKGYMVAGLRGGDIITAALRDLKHQGIAYRLVDRSAVSGEQFLMENQPFEDAVFELSDRGLFGGTMPLGKRFDFTFGGREWSFEAAPMSAHVNTQRGSGSWMVLIGGLLLTSLVGAFVMVISGRRVMLQAIVSQQTANLRSSEHRLAEAQRIAQLGNWTMELDAHSMWLSQEARRILDSHVTGEDWTLGGFAGHFPLEHRDALVQALTEVVKTHESYNADLQVVSPSGLEKTVNVHGELVYDEHKRPTRVVGTIQDISARIRLDRMKQEFVSTVSHELRTPLTSVKGSLGMVAAGALGDLPDKAMEMVRIAHRNTDQLIHLVNDILDLGKFESGEMVFKMEHLNLSDLILEAIEVNQNYARDYGTHFMVTSGLENVYVLGDSQRILQVMANLLSNAAKFSPSGTIVGIALEKDDGFARIKVTDSGPGIPKEFRGRIFEKFAQADGTSQRKEGGTGLGLAITKMIVERLGGEIGFQSEVDIGTTFYFTLPLVD
ncbi:CHASE domain-containing protein [Magnetovibrio sp. PR-2]|uniref:CHASE domain-containing protein n=1 Tax=Magnetovibrio sp. PR-2 TaxID=3120356 RepID=UPI002FCE1E0E